MKKTKQKDKQKKKKKKKNKGQKTKHKDVSHVSNCLNNKSEASFALRSQSKVKLSCAYLHIEKPGIHTD